MNRPVADTAGSGGRGTHLRGRLRKGNCGRRGECATHWRLLRRPGRHPAPRSRGATKGGRCVVSAWRVGGVSGSCGLVLMLLAGPVLAQSLDAPERLEPGVRSERVRDLLAQRIQRRPAEEEPKPEPAPAAPGGAPAAPGAPAAAPGAPEAAPLRTPIDQPLGPAGPSGIPLVSQTTSDFLPLPDRWRTGFPRWDRYGRSFDSPYVEGKWWDPYTQSVIKGDYPIWGQYTFFNLTAISDTLVEFRKLPTPQGISTARRGENPFFGEGDQFFMNQNFILTFELFHGLTSFRPRDWEIRFTPVFQFNYLNTQENSAVNVNPVKGVDRFDTDMIGIQEALVEYHIADLSPYYDFVSVRAGIQPFLSDFRGFLFADNEPGVRFLGNYFANRLQYNLVYFYMLEKDTNSGLNRLSARDQNVVIANLFYQDFIWPGYTAQLSFHYNNDMKS